MFHYIVLPCTAVEVATGGAAATLTTGLDTTQSNGRAVYELAVTAAAWVAQGVVATVFTAVAATDICSTIAAHGMSTGWVVQVSNAGGALPAGLAAVTNYWVIRVDDLNFKLATSYANAIAGTAIDLTTNGTGVQTMDTVATAGAGSHQVSPSAPVLLDGVNGAKISVIQDAAAGKATIARTQG